MKVEDDRHIIGWAIQRDGREMRIRPRQVGFVTSSKRKRKDEFGKTDQETVRAALQPSTFSLQRVPIHSQMRRSRFRAQLSGNWVESNRQLIGEFEARPGRVYLGAVTVDGEPCQTKCSAWVVLHPPESRLTRWDQDTVTLQAGQKTSWLKWGEGGGRSVGKRKRITHCGCDSSRSTGDNMILYPNLHRRSRPRTSSTKKQT